MRIRSTVLTLVALCLAALPAIAADRVIQRGVDIWETVPQMTYTSFANNPIPAGFFCAEFPGYTGRMWFKGVPLASDDPGALGTTDTIIERLDNAVFNKNGVARTRARVRALQLEGIEALKTVCGDYNVKVTLDGEQPVTRMRIVREHAKGGRFFVPLALNVKLTFTRVDNPAEQLEFFEPVRFAVSPHHHWSYRKLAPEAKRIGRVTVDTDGDGTPDTVLPGTSNFRAGNGNKAEFCPQNELGGHAVTEPGPLPTAEAE
ncbi:MAG TPA: hypothetical protein VEL74_19450 [Thermoanaerobaculia bacterium]|nr:hypothetical protein [Thermoanaerobaculia bacterium]